MTEVLEEFSQLMDPSHDAPLLERMVLIANTSNMPVAAREASIYLGMTIAEYYRDMGYDVAMMADSTSRWAEALREIAGRLEEMPGEEGYPAYLGSRLAQYYERAGRVIPLCGENKEGSVTIINAVSPPGGDFSEPVTQSSLRLAGAFWGLDKQLAQQRHFPAINWNSSYTLYSFQLQEYFLKQMGEEWESLKRFLTVTLDKEKRLKDLVQIVGRDGLSESDKWVLEFADLAKIFFLQQNAFSEEDAWCDLEKQKYMITVLKELNKMILEKIGKGTLFEQIHDFPFRKMLLELRKYSAEEMVVHAEKMYEEIERTVVEQVVE
jgi:V/A-type H+-transporting ATPase subunit A